MARTSRIGILAFVVGTALFVTFYLANYGRPGIATVSSSQSLRYRPHLTLEEEIQLSEQYYQEAMPERMALVKKFGPTIDKIKSFPTNSDFYTLWDFFLANFRCPHRVERIGTRGDGGKWVCGMDVVASKKHPVVYSFGLNGESSFEAAILERAPTAELYGYDFSVNSFGPEIEKVPALKSRAHFFPYALGGVDKHGPSDDPPVWTLQSLMEKNGHTFIDILKIDIEGNEFDSLSALFDSYLPSSTFASFSTVNPLPFGQMQLEIHAWGEYNESFKKFLKWWERLEKVGLRPFWTEPNLVYVNVVRGAVPWLAEYSFINIKGKHELITDMSDIPSH